MYMDILSKLVIKKIHSVSRMYSESGKVKRNNRSNWAIVLKYEGETVYTAQGKKYISNLNNMVILPKGLNYEVQFLKPGHFYIIEFESDITHNDILHCPIKNSDKILSIIKKTEYNRTLKKPLYEIDSIQNTYKILLELFNENSKIYVPGTKQEKLNPVMDYIAKNYTKKIKNDELSALTGLSTDYFRKIFFQTYGTSPIEYINRLRIKKAQEMLISDYKSITDIANSLGYENIYDFSRSFKKYAGISPSKYSI